MKTRKQNGRGCPSGCRVTARSLLSWLAIATVAPTSASWSGSQLRSPDQAPLFAPSTPPFWSPSALAPPQQDHEFTLRHIFHHGTHEYPNVHVRMDVKPGEEVWMMSGTGGEREKLGPLRARSRPEPIERLSDRSVATVQTMYDAARRRGSAATLDSSAWTVDEVAGPNVTDKQTVLSLAKMTWNAYTREPGTGEWQDLKGFPFNHSQAFGWEGDGLRGHIFADKDNKTIVVSVKGTSPAVFDGTGTTTNDKENDNLFFACCCGQGGHYLWHQVCDCMTSAFTCNQTCLVKSLREKNRYYTASIELYGNVTELYPDSNIWLAGHSLGGSTSALLGLTFGLPVVTFEAPGDALAAARLGLPAPPSSHPGAPQTRRYTGARHFGHTADPIFMGSCNTATAFCTLGGYAMQTECHTGQVCIYDTVEDKGWRVGVGNHKIASIVNDVIDAYDEVAPCRTDEECVDCFNWKYFESNGTDKTSSSSSTSSTAAPTRTTTCQTPGWWGCLDPTTTPTATSITTSSMSSTSPNSMSSELPSTSCLSYGWFGGCLETTTITPTSPTPTSPPPSTASPEPTTTPNMLTTSCVEYGWLGGCLESTTVSVAPPSAITTATGCIQFGWFGCVQTTTMTVWPTSCLSYGWWGIGPCVSSTTLSPTSVPTAPMPAIPGPTITTTRPLPTTHRPFT